MIAAYNHGDITKGGSTLLIGLKTFVKSCLNPIISIVWNAFGLMINAACLLTPQSGVSRDSASEKNVPCTAYAQCKNKVVTDAQCILSDVKGQSATFDTRSSTGYGAQGEKMKVIASLVISSLLYLNVDIFFFTPVRTYLKVLSVAT